jgi:hypothetical protein
VWNLAKPTVWVNVLQLRLPLQVHLCLFGRSWAAFCTLAPRWPHIATKTNDLDGQFGVGTIDTATPPTNLLLTPMMTLPCLQQAGVCHSDLHLWEGSVGGFKTKHKPPFVLGHEMEGVVLAVGQVRSLYTQLCLLAIAAVFAKFGLQGDGFIWSPWRQGYLVSLATGLFGLHGDGVVWSTGRRGLFSIAEVATQTKMVRHHSSSKADKVERR